MKHYFEYNILGTERLICGRPDWYGVLGIPNVPDFVDPYSLVMLEYDKVSSGCLLGSILGTRYLICGKPHQCDVSEIPMPIDSQFNQ